MNIRLETLVLTPYNEIKHLNLKEELTKGESKSQYIYQISDRLEASKNFSDSIYQRAFVIEDEGVPIGYLYISNMMRDEVFLEYSILKEYRRMGYGSSIVYEVTDYLFEKHNIKSVRLDIDPSNKNSVLLATSCGFALDEEEYEKNNFIGKMQFVKESNCYVPKRRKY